MKGLKLGLEFPLRGRDGGVLGAQLVQLLVAIGQLLFSLAASAIRLLEKCTALLELVLKSVRPPLRDPQQLSRLVARPLLLLQRCLHVLQLLLVSLYVLLRLGVRLVRVIQSDLQLVYVRLQFLLHA